MESKEFIELVKATQPIKKFSSEEPNARLLKSILAKAENNVFHLIDEEDFPTDGFDMEDYSYLPKVNIPSADGMYTKEAYIYGVMYGQEKDIIYLFTIEYDSKGVMFNFDFDTPQERHNTHYEIINYIKKMYK